MVLSSIQCQKKNLQNKSRWRWLRRKSSDAQVSKMAKEEKVTESQNFDIVYLSYLERSPLISIYRGSKMNDERTDDHDLSYGIT